MPRLLHPLDLAIGVLVAALLVAPAVLAGGLAGSPGAEVYGHAWVQWWASAAWPAWPAGTSLAVGAESWPVIDPLPTWIVAGLAKGIGFTAAWNVWVASGVVLAAAGGGALARALGGSGPVGAAGVATMPIFLGSLTSGLTEDYALGLVALALAALATGRRALGGLLLGASAWCGLYLAWLGGLAAVALALVRVRDAPFRWLLAGALALALAAPAVAPFRARLEGQGHRAGVHRVEVEPRWRINPWRGADLASFAAPGKVDTEGAMVREHPVYLGYLTTGLAAFGGWHPAVLGVLACVSVAPGAQLTWAGVPLGVDNPAMPVFQFLPFASRFNHHARVMLLGQLLLVGLAARGASKLARRLAGDRGGDTARFPSRMRAGELAIVGLLLGEVAFSPARLPLPVAPVASPDIYGLLAGFPEGLPVVVVGAAGPGVHPQRVFFDQRAHGRRLLHNPNRPADGRPVAGAVVVALGSSVARVSAERGAPTLTAADGAAWAPSGTERSAGAP